MLRIIAKSSITSVFVLEWASASVMLVELLSCKEVERADWRFSFSDIVGWLVLGFWVSGE